MTKGKRFNDDVLWAGMGEKWQGWFDIRVLWGSKVLFKAPLNDMMLEKRGDKPGELFFFAPEFKLHIDEYTNDKQPDFNIGQYGSSVGNDYWLFTVMPNGVISRLPFDDWGNPSPIFVELNGTSNTTDRIVKDGKRIKFQYSLRGEDEDFTDWYIWRGGYFRLSEKKHGRWVDVRPDSQKE